MSNVSPELRKAMLIAADKFESGEWLWGKGSYGYNGFYEGTDNGRYCIIGGITKAGLWKSPYGVQKAVDAEIEYCLLDFTKDSSKYPFPANSVVSFNDYPETTVTDVVKLLRCCSVSCSGE